MERKCIAVGVGLWVTRNFFHCMWWFLFFPHLIYIRRDNILLHCYKILNTFFRLAAFFALIYDPSSWFYLLPAFSSVHPSSLNFSWLNCPGTTTTTTSAPSQNPVWVMDPAGLMYPAGLRCSSFLFLASHFAFLYIRRVKLQPGLSAFFLFGSVLLAK